MLTFFSVIHVLLCVFMIFVILLQPGKDAGMGAALGGGATQTAFGGRGAVTFLSKVTAVCAIAFFVTSLGLSFVGLRTTVIRSEDIPAAPAKPATTDTTATPPAEGSTGDMKPVNPDDVTKKAAEPEKPIANDGVPAEKATP